MQLHGSIFFGAVHALEEALQVIDEMAPSKTHLLLLAGGINFADLAGAQLLAQEAARRRSLGGGLYLYQVKPELMAVLERTQAAQTIGIENIYATGQDAISDIRSRLSRG